MLIKFLIGMFVGLKILKNTGGFFFLFNSEVQGVGKKKLIFQLFVFFPLPTQVSICY